MTNSRSLSVSSRRATRRQAAHFVLKALPSALALVFSQASGAVDIAGAAGLPQGGTVFSGSASGSVTGNHMTITQDTSRAVLDWLSFNIGADKSVQFVQPDAASAVLNRITADANASQILGSLTANGTVMLMNPNGVMFGPNSVINVASLIATTGTIDVSHFIGTGGARITGAAGSITNQGTITAAAGGLVALVAPSVTNEKSIAAVGGTIALGGSTAATISLNGGLYEFAIPSGATGNAVTNAAGASLQGATLLIGVGDAAGLLTGVVNLEGVQQASSAIVVHGDHVHLKSALQAPGVSGTSNTVDVYAGARIQDGVKIAKTGTPGDGATVHVNAGTYTEQVVLNKANLTLAGREGAKIFVPTPDLADNPQIDGVTISASNVTVSGLEIAGDLGNQSHLDHAWDNRITRGIAVRDGATHFTISGNNIHDVRNGILIHGRHGTQNQVTGNRIENTKGAISVQYTDGSGINIAGNTQGPNGNEWGLNLHLNGHMDGAGNIVGNTPPIAAAPTLSWQQALLALSTSNDGWSVQDQGYTSSNRTHVNVAAGGSAGAQGSARSPINTLQGGINAVVTGGTVRVADGNYVQSSTLNINKSLTLSGAGEASTVIDARGVNGYGMTVTADDVTLNNFTFYGPTANVGSAYGIKVSPLTGAASDRLHNFAISNVTIRGSGRAELDLNGVVGAVIDHVTADGRPVGNNAGDTAGAGIQITDSQNVRVRHSTTRGNQWGGLAIYQANRVYNQQVNNITVEANNSFGELNPAYLQDESVSRDFGTLNIAGFDYAVRNRSSTNNNHQYTWLQATEQNAFNLAVNTQSSGDSYVQGWSGAGTTQNFLVGTGHLTAGGTRTLSIDTAVKAAEAGASINVRAGTYAENVSINKALTITGAGVDQSIVTPDSGDAFALSGNIGAGASVVIDGFTFRDAPGSGVSVANSTVLGELTVQNSSFSNNGRFGFTVNGSSTAGVALSNVLLRNNRFTGNGNPAAGAPALGLGNVHFNYFNGNATLQDLHITGAGEHNGIHFRGYHTAGGAVRDAGRVVFDNVTVDGSYRRPAGSVGTWNPEGPGYGIHFFEYASVDNVSFNNVVVDTTVGHGIVVEGLGSTLDIGNTRFGRPDTTIVGVGSNPTASLNIATGTNSQNNVRSHVDATGASFTGATSGFDIEDRVGHALDATGLGLVTWDAGQVYVTQKSGSVQRGVDAAGLGDTVNVAGAGFAEDVAVNTRRNLAFNDTRLQSLTLGSGAAGSGIGGAVTAEGAGGFNFNANVNLLADTTLTTRGADITLNGDIQNAGGVARALRLIAGSGGARGNLHMSTGGANGALGRLEVVASRFSLADTLWVGSYSIDALGDVALSSHTLNAQDSSAASSLNAGGNVSGSTTTQGSVAVVSGGDITGNISASTVVAEAAGTMNVVVHAQQTANLSANTLIASITATDVVAQAQGNMNVSATATNSANFSANSVTATVTAPVLTVAAVSEATVSGSAGQVTLDAPRGSVSGSFGQVTNSGGGIVNVNGKPQANSTVSSNAENNRVVSTAGVKDGGVEGVGQFQVAQADGPNTGMSFSTPESAGQALDRGQTVELDMSPRNQRSQDKAGPAQDSESEQDKKD